MVPVTPPAHRDGRIALAPVARFELFDALTPSLSVPVLEMARSAGTTGFRSFQDTTSSECRIRRMMQFWKIVCGKTALLASGKPFSPSTTAIKIS